MPTGVYVVLNVAFRMEGKMSKDLDIDMNSMIFDKLQTRVLNFRFIPWTTSLSVDPAGCDARRENAYEVF